MQRAEGGATHRRATIQDVARLAGVSAPTVSRALSGKGRIGAATRKRVEEVARELSFTPNPLAQGLLAGKTGTVGLLTNDLEGRFSIPVLTGAEDALGNGSTSVFLCDARGNAAREARHLEALLNRRVDGLIVVADRTDPRPSLGQELPVPVVYAYAPSDAPQDLSVVPDNIGAGRLVAEHIVQIGREHIAYIGGNPGYLAAGQRAQGVEEVLEQAGLCLVGGQPLFGRWSEVWGRAATEELLNAFPEVDAIICGSDQIARGALDVLRDHGVRVPSDIAVIGHDNWAPIVTQSRPPLSTVDMELETVGRTAAQVLFAAMRGEPVEQHHLVPSRLVVCGSTVEQVV